MLQGSLETKAQGPRPHAWFLFCNHHHLVINRSSLLLVVYIIGLISTDQAEKQKSVTSTQAGHDCRVLDPPSHS